MRRDAERTGAVPPNWNGGGGGVAGRAAYNEFWWDRGNRVVKTKRTSLIIDPPDGRFPPFTPEGNQRMERREEVRRNTAIGHPIADSWEDRPLQERCLLGLNAGPPMFPGAYNNNVQIFQNRDYVMLLIEMVHDVRVVPLDGRPHGHIPQWKGDSRGHWEGDTLVVDTANFRPNAVSEDRAREILLTDPYTLTVARDMDSRQPDSQHHYVAGAKCRNPGLAVRDREGLLPKCRMQKWST